MNKHKHPHRFFNATSSGGTLTLDMYDYIGASMYGSDGITEGMVSAALKTSDSKSVTLNINSPGGDAFAGVAIRNVLVQSNKKVLVNVVGLAASAAGVIAMAGDTITMHSGSVLMIHPAQSLEMGSASDMRKMADTLDTVTGSIADIFVAKTGLDKATILEMLNAETWMSAEDAVAKGFATSVAKEKSAVKNSYDLKMYHHVPPALLNAKKAKSKPDAEPDEAGDSDTDEECECACPECSEGDCENCSCISADCVCPQQDDEPIDNFATVPTFDNLSILRHRLEMNKRK